MFAQFDKSTSTLGETIRSLTQAADKEARSKEAMKGLPLYWTGAVNWLFDKIENVYLIEFLILNAVSIQRRKAPFFLLGLKPFDLERLTIVIGSERVDLVPVAYDKHRAAVRVVNRRTDDTVDLFCDLTGAHPRWMVVKQETGLRRLLQNVLPEAAVPLDETMFRDVLDRVLSGSQPIFSFDPKQVRGGIGHLLDFVTSDEVRRSLSLGVRSSVSHLGKQLLLAGPAVKAVRDRTLGQGGAAAGGGEQNAQLEYHPRREDPARRDGAAAPGDHTIGSASPRS